MHCQLLKRTAFRVQLPLNTPCKRVKRAACNERPSSRAIRQALADLAAIEPVIAHEMTHSALSHLALPRWLDEGLAVDTEQRLTGVRPLIYTPQELRIKHLQFWGRDEVQEFWFGETFFGPMTGICCLMNWPRMTKGRAILGEYRYQNWLDTKNVLHIRSQIVRITYSEMLAACQCSW